LQRGRNMGANMWNRDEQWATARAQFE
jgi:hypothetical protein